MKEKVFKQQKEEKGHDIVYGDEDRLDACICRKECRMMQKFLPNATLDLLILSSLVLQLHSLVTLKAFPCYELRANGLEGGCISQA